MSEENSRGRRLWNAIETAQADAFIGEDVVDLKDKDIDDLINAVIESYHTCQVILREFVESDLRD